MRMTAIVVSSISGFLCEIMVNIYTISGISASNLYFGEFAEGRRIPAFGVFPRAFAAAPTEPPLPGTAPRNVIKSRVRPAGTGLARKRGFGNR